MIRKLLLFPALATLSAVSLSAALLTPQYAISPVANAGMPFNTTSSVQQFDDLGGTRTLTKIHFYLNGTIEGFHGADNQTASQQDDIDLTTVVTMKLTFSGVDLVITLPTATTSISLAPTTGEFLPNFEGPDAYVATFGPISLGTAGSTTTQSILDAFTGNGTVAMGFDADGETTTTAGIGVATYSEGSGSATGWVQYEYTSPIPEPGTYAMLGGGLAVLGLIGRRRLRA